MAIDGAWSAPGDAVADTLDTAELLAVEMQQFARPLALVAHHRRHRIECFQASQPEAAQHRAHGRARQAELAGNLLAGQALPAQPLDLAIALAEHAVAVSGGRRAPIMKGDLAARPIPLEPYIGSPLRQTRR